MGSKKSGSFLGINIHPLLFIALLVVTIPVTILFLRTQQDSRQRASGDTVSGVVFKDDNGNKKQDSGELGVPDAKIEIFYFADASSSAMADSPTPASGKQNMWKNIFLRNGSQVYQNRKPQSYSKYSTASYKQAEVTTDSSGLFTYKPDLAEFYIVRLVLPKGYMPTTLPLKKLTNLSDAVSFGVKTYTGLAKDKFNPHAFPSIDPVLFSPPADGPIPASGSSTGYPGISGIPVIDPSKICIPRPSCLDSTPSCMIAEPVIGWCKGDASPIVLPPDAPACPPTPKCDNPLIPVSDAFSGYGKVSVIIDGISKKLGCPILMCPDSIPAE